MNWIIWSMRDDYRVGSFHFGSSKDILTFLGGAGVEYCVRKINNKIKIVFVS